ncbi:cation:proton antiporter [Dankookia sp. P2]|uniref:cation:proton antiporter domain-containing protein n=1 Tax=Dankookia sp. P2 TaxID=3423955 RepID=UPI003D67C24A
MASPVHPSDFKEVLIILGAAGVVVPLFHRLRVSPVLGFLLVGMAVGPSGLGALARQVSWLEAVTITNAASIGPIADLGVVMLLFMIGLELSLERLLLMRRLVFGLGSLHVVLTTAGLAAAAFALGQPPPAAVTLGLTLAMSSTAVVVQVLSEGKRLSSAAGRASIAVLLMQDLAVVPVLFGVAVLGTGPAAFGIAISQAAFAVGAVILVGRLSLRPLFRTVARTRSPELFMAACLLVVLGTGLATAVVGLSMTMGALIAGLLLAETEYRRQIEATVEPFKGLLIGVFLVSIGMSLDLAQIAAQPFIILAAALALVGGKLALTAILARAFGIPWAAGLQAGLLLGPGGEFSFVILAPAATLGLVSQDAADFALLLAALTMAAIPLLSIVGKRLTFSGAAKPMIDPAALPGPETTPRVVIAGFGRVGQMVAAMLEVHRVPYVALDSDPDEVAKQRARGKQVYYGDVTNIELVRHLQLDTARALVATMNDRNAVDELVTAARRERQDLLVIARARDEAHATHLYSVGVTDAVPETIEASLQLAEAVLVDVGIPMGPVIVSIHEKRAEIQRQVRASAPEAERRAVVRRRLREALLARGASDRAK